MCSKIACFKFDYLFTKTFHTNKVIRSFYIWKVLVIFMEILVKALPYLWSAVTTPIFS